MNLRDYLAAIEKAAAQLADDLEAAGARYQETVAAAQVKFLGFESGEVGQ